MIGKIVAISYGEYSVVAEGKTYEVSPRGIFRKNHQKPLVGDVVGIKEKEISHYFPGMHKSYLECYFLDCMHISETRCKIKESVQEGIIPSIFYESYLKLVKEIKER